MTKYTTNTRYNPKYKEIFKLVAMLTEAGIPHKLSNIHDGWQVFYPVDLNQPEYVMDAIEHSGSYGNDVDLLEIMGLLTPDEEQDDSVVGWLTAEEVFERIRKHYNGEWDNYIESLSALTPEDETSENPGNTPMTPRRIQASYD